MKQRDLPMYGQPGQRGQQGQQGQWGQRRTEAVCPQCGKPSATRQTV